jgi:hypothetical protein
MNLGFVEKCDKKLALGRSKMVGDDVALVQDLLVGDDVIKGEDAVVGEGVASILDRFNQISENNERKDN